MGNPGGTNEIPAGTSDTLIKKGFRNTSFGTKHVYWFSPSVSWEELFKAAVGYGVYDGPAANERRCNRSRVSINIPGLGG